MLILAVLLVFDSIIPILLVKKLGYKTQPLTSAGSLK